MAKKVYSDSLNQSIDYTQFSSFNPTFNPKKGFAKNNKKLSGLTMRLDNLNLVCNKSILQICVNNVKPILETRKIRKLKLTYKVPLVAGLSRQEGKAVFWLTQLLSLNSVSDTVNSNLCACFINQIGSNVNKKLYKNNLLKHRFYKDSKSIKNKNTTNLNLPLLHHTSLSLSPLQGNPESNPLFSLKGQVAKGKEKEGKYGEIYLTRFYNFTLKNQFKMTDNLSQQFLNAFSSKAESMEKRKQFHQDALKNRAYLNYRWW